MKATMAGLMVIATLASGAAQAKDGQNAAVILGGVAAGAIGGAVLGTVLNNRQPAPPPAPVYVRPPPPPVALVEPYRPVRQVVVESPYDDQAFSLKEACDSGSRHACIRFGIMIGKHQERVATWRRTHPDFFSYED